MSLVKTNLQNFFKKVFYSLFILKHGKIKSVINPEENKKIEVKLVKKSSSLVYKVYKITSGRLYTDRINDTSILIDDSLIRGASFQFRYGLQKVINEDEKKNIVFTKGTPRFKKNLNGRVLSLLTGGAGNHNYWHWLFDVLPRLSLCEEMVNLKNIDYFLLPDNKKKFQKETLEILKIPEDRQLSSVKFRHIVSNELYVTDHPYLMGKDATLSIQNIPDWISAWVKKSFIISNNNKNKFSKKIYISRIGDDNSNLRSIINEDEVRNFLVKKGFDIVILENLRFKDQVDTFNNAEQIVGLHGAGFANLVFCKEGTKVIEIKSKTAGDVIKNLALKNNLNHKSLNFEPTKHDFADQSGHINVSTSLLSEMLEK
tara:strand:- start:708 stop:1820 length:1113 start_codon:yes stop_codon:yes gene_type:complete